VFGIRPEDLDYTPNEKPGTTLKAEVTVVEPLGAEIHLYARTATHSFVARVNPDHNFTVGEKVYFTPRLANSVYFDIETEAALNVEGVTAPAAG